MIFSKMYSRLLAGCGIAALAVSVPAIAMADDFTIDTPVNVTNGGFLINGDDTLTITPTGSITTNLAPGVLAFGGNNTIDNQGAIATTGLGNGIDITNNSTVRTSGTVSTVGDLAVGIAGLSGNTVSVSGSVSTQGVGAQGIVMLDTNTIDVSGRVSTASVTAAGIAVRDNNTITVTDSGVVETVHSDAIVNTTSPALVFQDNNIVNNHGVLKTEGIASPGMFGRDSNTISNSGSITTTNGLAPGIGVRNDNTVGNTGSISTSEIESPGIAVVDRNSVTNGGSISTAGNFSVGILADDDNTEIANSGTVTTSGDDSNAIDVGDRNLNVSNTGPISTTGILSQGIRANNDNVVTNSSSINTTGFLSDGIDLNNRNTLTMPGTIDTTGPAADGIDMVNANTVDVSGMILTTGIGSDAIEAENRNKITISGGKIVSAAASSFNIGRNNTIHLDAPAFLGGPIDYGILNDFNITTGQSHSVLWDFSNGTPNSFNVSGTVPWFYNAATQQFATIDPTIFAANVDQLGEWTNMLTNMLASQLGAGGGAADGSSTFAFGDTEKGERTFWVRGLGSTASFDADGFLHEYDYDLYGVALGADGYVRDDVKLGVVGGYYRGNLTSDARYARSYDNDSDNWFLGIYGRKTKGEVLIDFNLIGGYQSTDQWRFVNDNLAPLGNGSASSSYDAWYISPEISVGTSIATAGGWAVQPTGRLRYTYQSIDGYTETSMRGPATVGSQDIQLAEGRLELAFQRQTNTIDTRVFGGYLGRYSLGDDNVNVTLVGVTTPIPIGTDDFQSLGYVGADVFFKISPKAGIKAGIVYTGGDGVSSFGGSGGITVEF